jgi:hypothetical protein
VAERGGYEATENPMGWTPQTRLTRWGTVVHQVMSEQQGHITLPWVEHCHHPWLTVAMHMRASRIR